MQAIKNNYDKIHMQIRLILVNHFTHFLILEKYNRNMYDKHDFQDINKNVNEQKK